MRLFLSLTLSLIFVSCKGTSNTATDVAPLVLDLSFCQQTQNLSFGRLCAIQPSLINAQTKDQYGSGSMQDQNYGFGYHVFAVPSDWNKVKGLWVHFTGTYGRPFNPNNQSYESAVWLNELLEQGYAVIQLAYDNRFSVNSDTCTNPNPGYNRDNCAGEVREEVLTGTDVTPYRSTDTFNSVDFRLSSLLSFLKNTQHISLPDDIDPQNIDWRLLRISGHSQGGTLAYYIARKRSVHFACMLASPYDSPDSVNPGAYTIADWFTSGSSQTPLDHLGSIIATADSFYTQFSYGHSVIGLVAGQSSIVVTNATFTDDLGNSIDGHSGTIKDPSLKTQRNQACFR